MVHLGRALACRGRLPCRAGGGGRVLARSAARSPAGVGLLRRSPLGGELGRRAERRVDPLRRHVLRHSPAPVFNQTIRNVITPHLGGTRVRVHLTNRYNPHRSRSAAVTIGVSQPDGGVTAPIPVLFDGQTSVTAGPGSDVVSDPVNLAFDAFTPLAVSIYVPSLSWQLTKHWNSNATTYITPADAGDADRRHERRGLHAPEWRAGSACSPSTSRRRTSTRAIVAFGDSLTDGWVSADPILGVDTSLSNANVRYPDFLQRRIIDAGLPLSIINSGLVRQSGGLDDLPDRRAERRRSLHRRRSVLRDHPRRDHLRGHQRSRPLPGIRWSGHRRPASNWSPRLGPPTSRCG